MCVSRDDDQSSEDLVLAILGGPGLAAIDGGICQYPIEKRELFA
jgi:hypothetical protein